MCERLFSDRKGKNSPFTNEEKLKLKLKFPTPLLFPPPLPAIINIYYSFQPPPYYSSPPIIRNLRVETLSKTSLIETIHGKQATAWRGYFDRPQGL